MELKLVEYDSLALEILVFKLYLYGIEINWFRHNFAEDLSSNCTFMELKYDETSTPGENDE